MFFDRARIKETAKTALKRSHWMVVLAVLITTLLGGYVADTAVGGGASLELPFGNEDTDTIDPDVDVWAPGADEDTWEDNPWVEGDGSYVPDSGLSDFSWDGLWESITAELGDLMPFFTGAMVFLGVLVIIAALSALALSIFVGNVMTVGGHGWLLRYWRGEVPTIGEVFASFRIYKPTVVTMLVKDVYVFLWSLLFVIPGIIKSFAYSMVPYIIYENPNLSVNDALKMSEKMTDGYKGDLFVFNLSFFGWHLLSAITGGLVGILYVNPYMGVAHAGVYEDLKWNAIQSGRLTWEDFGQTPPPADDPWAPPASSGGYTYTAPAAPYGAPAPYYTPPANPYGASSPTYTPPTDSPVPTAPTESGWNHPAPPQE